MPRTRMDHHKADEQLVVQFQKKVPESFGRIEYLVAYNDQGRGFLFVRDGNDVEPTQGQVDIVWKTVTEALDLKRNMDVTSKGEPERQSYYQRIESFQGPNMIWHTMCSADCGTYGVGRRCRDYKISIPVREEQRGADITAGSTVLSEV